jgi:NAD(P)H dehydrogenase (quinone)
MLLIGATGKIGQHLVPALVVAGARPTVLARDVDRARARLGGDVDYVAGDLTSPGGVQLAMAGHEVVYLANGQTDRQVELETAAIDAAVGAGVRRIVKISAHGAEAGPADGVNVFARWHAEIERHLEATPLVATILRPNMFDDNLLGSAPQITQGQLYSAAEDGLSAWVDPADIAAVAAAALLDDAHAGRTYAVSGPEAISHDELAERFTAVLGRPVTHIRIDDDAFRSALTSAGLPGWTVDAFVEMNARGVRGGHFGEVSDDVPTVLGRPAAPVTSWIERNAAAFRD